MGRSRGRHTTRTWTANDHPIRANWKNKELVKLFINLCLDEVSTSEKNDGTLHEHSWNNIEKKFVENGVQRFTKKQLKDQWYLLKNKYKVWSNLVDNATNNASYPTTSMHWWGVERWVDYVKKNRDAKQFGTKGLEYAAEMKLLFDRDSGSSLSSSQEAMGSSEMNTDTDAKGSPASSSEDSSLLPKDRGCMKRSSLDFNGQLERAGCGTSKEGSPPDSGGPASSSHVAMESPQMNNDTDNKGSPASSSDDSLLPKDKGCRKRSSVDFNGQLERAECGTSKEGLPSDCGGSVSSSQVAMESSQMNNDTDSKGSPASSNDVSLPKDNGGKKISSIFAYQKRRRSSIFNGQFERDLKTLKKCGGATLEECNHVLDVMEKIKTDSPLYVAACSIFCESQTHREQWMMLSKKPEEVRISWIQMISKKLGLL